MQKAHANQKPTGFGQSGAWELGTVMPFLREAFDVAASEKS